MCHTNFLNENSGAIQAISSVILVGVTIVYACITKQMSNAVKRQQDLAEKPYIGMDRDIEMEVKQDVNMPNNLAERTDFINIKFKVFNIAKVPTALTWQSSFNDVVVKIDHKVILFPDQNIFFNSHFNIHEIVRTQLQGKFKIHFDFCALNDETNMYFFERTITIDNSGRYRIIDNDKAGKS